MDKRYFREIFGLHAKDDKINYEGLCKIFEMVDFKPNEKQEVEFKAMFSKKEEISFNGNVPSHSLFSRFSLDFQPEKQLQVQPGRRQKCLQGMVFKFNV